MDKRIVEIEKKLTANEKITSEELEYYEQAAQQGNAEAQYNLGYIYYNGLGVAQNYQKAIYYTEQAAQQGHSGAQYNLGYIYYKGLGVEQNYQKAKEYYEQAAQQGHPEAQYNLGYIYYNGLGVAQNYQKAIYYTEQAAQQGHSGAQYNLGYIYYNGIGVAQNYQKAKEYFKQAAQQGEAEAQYYLGIMYEDGIRVLKNYEKAIEYFKQAAEQGNAGAQYNLGIMYEDGLGVEQNYQKAIEYYEQAAQQGNINAQCCLGFMYYNGLGVDIDRDKALEIYKKIEQQNKTAERIIYTHKYISGEKIDFGKLFELNTKRYKDDQYFEQIKKRIDAGSEVISVESIMDLASEQLNKEFSNIDDIIKSIVETLNKKDKNTIISIRTSKNIYSEIFSDFYTVEDLKKIIKVIGKFFENIDLNQSEENLFMQMYVKLGMMIHYEYEAIIGKYKKNRLSTSRNLMILLKGKGVCVGYANTFKVLCDIAGIKCVVLSSKKNKKYIGHAFNQVRINGIWYNIDLTWDSPNIRCNRKLRNCLKSKKTFTQNIFHQTVDIDEEQETVEDYPNVQELAKQNIKKIKLSNIKKRLEQLLEKFALKEQRSKRK